MLQERLDRFYFTIGVFLFAIFQEATSLILRVFLWTIECETHLKKTYPHGLVEVVGNMGQAKVVIREGASNFPPLDTTPPNVPLVAH
jgi:hypothetical protein